jgi:hypothetical protein
MESVTGVRRVAGARADVLVTRLSPEQAANARHRERTADFRRMEVPL